MKVEGIFKTRCGCSRVVNMDRDMDSVKQGDIYNLPMDLEPLKPFDGNGNANDSHDVRPFELVGMHGPFDGRGVCGCLLYREVS